MMFFAMIYPLFRYFTRFNEAKKELKWSSKNTNQDMIKESYDWYLSNRDELLTNTNQKSLHKSKVKQGILYIIGKFL